MKVLSLYCGAGGIDEGLKQAGIKTTLAVDVWKDACETFKLNHIDTEVICSKVSDIKDNLGEFDMVVGGPPCPEFSRAKTDRTFDACEVNNFWDIVYKVKAKYWIMENVQDVIKVIKNRKNYLVNCADYGVPQTRIRRIFTNLSLPKQTHSEFPTNDLFGNDIKKWISVKDALGIDGIIQDRKSTFGGGFRDYSVDRPSFTLVSDMRAYNVMKKGSKAYPEHHSFKYESNSINEPMCTITAKDHYTANEYIHDDKKESCRKLTVEELQILQGFPIYYKFLGSNISIRRQIGNAVPPPLIKAFAEQI